jgi:regulator of telomere elongation helicase 1
MVVLGSREQMCIHSDVQSMRGRVQNHACRSLTKGRNCHHYNRVAGMGDSNVTTLSIQFTVASEY